MRMSADARRRRPGFFVDQVLTAEDEKQLAEECAFDLARLALTNPDAAMRVSRFIDNLLARLEAAEA